MSKTMILLSKAIKGYELSYELGMIDERNSLVQLNGTRKILADTLHHVLADETLLLSLEKRGSNNELSIDLIYFAKKSTPIMNNIEIEPALAFTMEHILANVSKFIQKGSGFTITSVDEHYLNVAQYKPIKGSTFIPLPKELQNPKKGLINIQNKKDNECFRSCHTRFLNSQEKDPQRVKK